MNNEKKFKTILYTGTGAFLLGVVLLFIKTFLGLLLIFYYAGCMVYLQKKFPKELKEFREQQKKAAQKSMPQEMPHAFVNKFQFFNVEHISGVEYAKHKEKCVLSISSDSADLHDTKDDFLCSINFEDLQRCVIYQEIEQSLKDKSPLCRTIVGGILLGPVGAIAGGVSGLTPSVKKSKKYYLEFIFKDSDIFENIIISADLKTLEKINNLIVVKK